jgi:hypothetical protein
MTNGTCPAVVRINQEPLIVAVAAEALVVTVPWTCSSPPPVPITWPPPVIVRLLMLSTWPLMSSTPELLIVTVLPTLLEI